MVLPLLIILVAGAAIGAACDKKEDKEKEEAEKKRLKKKEEKDLLLEFENKTYNRANALFSDLFKPEKPSYLSYLSYIKPSDEAQKYLQTKRELDSAMYKHSLFLKTPEGKSYLRIKAQFDKPRTVKMNWGERTGAYDKPSTFDVPILNDKWRIK